MPSKKILSERQRFSTNSLPRLECGSRSRTSQVPGVLSREQRGHAGATPYLHGSLAEGGAGTPGPPPICTGPPVWSPSHFSSSFRCPVDVACCPDGFSRLRTSSAGQPCGESGTSGSEEGKNTQEEWFRTRHKLSGWFYLLLLLWGNIDG